MTGEQLSIINEIKAFLLEHNDMTMGQALYAATRPHGDKNRTDKLSDLLTITDDDILTNIEKSKELEVDTPTTEVSGILPQRLV